VLGPLEQEKYPLGEPSYVEQREGVYRVTGTRVSLDSIVYAFLDGHTAESIQQSFPLLTLEQVYGAITYYLAHREAIEAYLRKQEAAFETLKETLRRDNPQMAQRIAAIKQSRQTTVHDHPFSGRRESEPDHCACCVPS
jgi:uncharacterized protein (DUF433 family)